MSTILEKIAAYKRDEVALAKAETSESSLLASASKARAPRGFALTLTTHDGPAPALIAEVKKASPSKGLIRADFEPVQIAKAYETAGAACLSVLTDTPSFQGHNKYLTDVASAVSIPTLRKDFMLDSWQVLEARALGADAILIIMAMIDDSCASDLISTASDLGMDSLIEVHDQTELDRALKLESPLLGINNRNLKTFDTTLKTFELLARNVPDDHVLVAESGIFTPGDVERIQASGADAMLVGESLMRQADIETAVRTLISS